VTVTAWTTVAIFTVAYVLIAGEGAPGHRRPRRRLGDAADRCPDAEHTLLSEEYRIDWKVILLLLGMMRIVAVLKRTGVFEYIAIWAAKRAGGRPFRVMVILVLITAVASAALDNVTTVLLIAPVTFLVCERLGVPAAPFLIAEAMASNIGGTSTLVGDPPNIIIASRGGLTYNDFLVHLAPLVALLVVVSPTGLWVLFSSAFRYDPEQAAQIARLRERDAISDGRLLVISVAVLGAVTAAFVLQTVLGLDPSVVAIIGGLLLLLLPGSTSSR
jgi:Na+/H+ antiporter NhaD/arsenite permease-like protein